MSQSQDQYQRKYEQACAKIVELQQALKQERAKRLAIQRRVTTDELTRLQSRRAFDEDGMPRFQRAMRGKTSVAMMFVDANAFKSVNDTYGHTVGDKLLVAIASAIRQSKRPADLAARKGGDEFVMFFDGVDQARASKLTARIHAAISAIRFDSAPGLRASVSIGVAVGVPHEGLDWKGLIAQADAAMYDAKKLKGTDRPTVCIRPLT